MLFPLKNPIFCSIRAAFIHFYTAKKNRAFLLIEVLVTVVVVSTSIVFINHAFTSSFKAAGLSNDYHSAILLLEDKSFDFELNPQALKVGELSGEARVMEKNFSWMQSVSPLEKEDLADEYEQEELGLNRLKLFLKWQRQNVERSIDILTYIQATELEE